MQKRTSEMSFSENFTSIHVVSKNIFEEFKPIVPWTKKMSDVRDKMVRSLHERPFKPPKLLCAFAWIAG